MNYTARRQEVFEKMEKNSVLILFPVLRHM